MEEKNDLGLVESIPERDIEYDAADVDVGEPLGLAKTSASKNANQLTSTMTKTLSRMRTSDTLDPGPAPDGGTVAWTQAVLGHLVIFLTWGFINSFGLFQSYYVDDMKIGNASEVAWIGTVQVFILFNIGTFSGRATDAGYFRLTFVCGAILSLVGIFTLSLCKNYWQVLLAQGICIGFGFGLIFVPSIALVSTYFLKKRSAALGIMVTGAAAGGLVFPAIGQQMFPTHGFAWTVRTMGFVQMFCLIVCALFLKPRLPPRKTGPIVEWAAFKELPYALYVTCGFFFFWSVYIGFFYITTFARNILGASPTTAINLILVLNGVGVIARLTMNISATFAGPINLLLPSIIGSAIMGFCWIAVHSMEGLWVFTCAYGITASALQGLWPVVLTSLTSDPKKVGVRTGMGFACVGWAVLTGPPIAGALISTANGSFLGCQIFAGTTMVISAIFLTATRWAVLRKRNMGWKWMVKV